MLAGFEAGRDGQGISWGFAGARGSAGCGRLCGARSHRDVWSEPFARVKWSRRQARNRERAANHGYCRRG